MSQHADYKNYDMTHFTLIMKDTYNVTTQSNIYSNKIVDSIKTYAECGLDWDAVKTPIVALLEGKCPLPIETHVSINRSDNNQSIGIARVHYRPIQNSKIWEALHTSLDGVDHKVVGGGYTHNGGRIFIQTEIKDADFKVNGDDFRNYITFYTSHDGSSAFEMFDTSTRIICKNTIQSGRRAGGKSYKIRVRDTASASIRFEGVMQNLESIFGSRRAAYADMSHLANTPMAYPEMIAWATGFFNRSNKLSTMSSAKAHEVAAMARYGIGNKGVTRYDMLNGVTEHLTHGDKSTKRSAASIWESSEFGISADTKAKALDNLTNLEEVSKTIERGQQLINIGEASA